MSLEFLSQEEVLLRIEHILGLERTGLDLSDNTLGYHSTSIESLFYLTRHGSLPGWNEDEEHQGLKPGDLFYVPRTLKPDWKEGEAKRDLLEYAQISAIKHHLFTRFGLERSNSNASGWFFEIATGLVYKGKATDWVIQNTSSKLGLPVELLRRAINSTQGRRGVTLSIDIICLKSYIIKPGEEDIIEMVLECPRGFEYKYFNGLVCHGELERRYIEDLSTYAQFLKSQKFPVKI